MKGYITNTTLDADKVIAEYHGLWVVERAFRISKGTLEMRPMFHFTERRIEAHVCICFVAYKLFKELERIIREKKIESSVNKVLETAKTDTILLLNHEEDSEVYFPECMNYCIFTANMLNELKYEPIEETITPGSNHFALLWFYLSHPEYKYYWNIEYDVEFSGKWSVLFDSFSDIGADFISTHIMGYSEEPQWYWWNSYQGKTMNIPPQERIRSFNPIYRISENALQFLNEFLKAGNSGHHEVLMPSSLFHSGFTIADFGGNGKFVPPEYENKFYLSTDLFIEKYPGGTMRCSPNFTDIESYNIPNKLFHPLKYSD